MRAMQMYMETIRGYPYMPKQRLADEFGISKSTVYARMKGIEEEIGRGRYDERAVIRDGNIVLVNTLVFVDYLKYRKALQEKNARKHVPPFRPEKWAWVSGWNSRVVTMEERGG